MRQPTSGKARFRGKLPARSGYAPVSVLQPEFYIRTQLLIHKSTDKQNPLRPPVARSAKAIRCFGRSEAGQSRIINCCVAVGLRGGETCECKNNSNAEDDYQRRIMLLWRWALQILAILNLSGFKRGAATSVDAPDSSASISLRRKSLDLLAALRWKSCRDALSSQATADFGPAPNLLGFLRTGWRPLANVSDDRVGADASGLLQECLDY